MLKLYDTMSKQVSELEPLEQGQIKMYTCGPTVYRDAHIGNLRTYLMADWIRRTLEFQGVSVTQVKNITDVGHMRQEMLERGEDKVVAAALSEGKTPFEIAANYTERFLSDEGKLNITPADQFPKATDHIGDMIKITEGLVEKGLAYEAGGNVYYEISKFPNYGQLSGNTGEEGLREGVRVEVDPLKRDPRDFTLWKAAEPGRELKWNSPWGEGFPGWHVECSAMSMKYLGQQFDLHTGGVDNVFPHHEAEIAQSEGFTGSKVVNRWVHGQHLLADGVKMAKSMGNTFILADIEARGIEPLAFRYLCLTAQHATRLNFTFTALGAAQQALQSLRDRIWEWELLSGSAEPDDDVWLEWRGKFLDHLNDNLDLPGALALTWELARSDLPSQTKLATLRGFDRVLGLGLDNVAVGYQVPDEIQATVARRSILREQAQAAEPEARQPLYDQADAVRQELSEAGYVIEDTAAGTLVRPRSTWEKRQEEWNQVSSSAEVDSLVDEPDTVDFTIGIVASNYVDDVSRCVQSALRWAGDRPIEVIVLDNGSTDGTGEWIEEVASKDERVRAAHTDHVLGQGAAANIVLKLSRGRIVTLLDTSVEAVGDFLEPLQSLLTDDTIGVAGPFGLRTTDLHHFHDGEGESGDMDAMQAYCFAFRRSSVPVVGLMRETFRFYRNLDLDYSFHFKDKGYRIVADPSLPFTRHEHRVWSELGEDEREDLSKKNYRRFLDKWGERSDLLVANQAPRAQ